MTIAGPAALFARKYRQQLFPDTPLLFASVDERFLRDAPLADNETAVAVDNDFPRLVDDILQLLPQTRQVFMVMGSGQLGQFWHRELETQFKRFGDRVTFVWSDDLSLAEILRRSASLPPDAAIFYFASARTPRARRMPTSGCSRTFMPRERSAVWRAQRYLGYGVVGGPMLSIDDLARNTADVADRLLNGAPPESIRVPPQRSRSTDIRLARVAALGHSREPVTARQRRALPRSEPVERIQGYRAERGRRAGRAVAPDRRAPVPAPRAAACRDREPEEPGARR